MWYKQMQDLCTSCVHLKVHLHVLKLLLILCILLYVTMLRIQIGAIVGVLMEGKLGMMMLCHFN